jgi:predicted Zn-dependent protease
MWGESTLLEQLKNGLQGTEADAFEGYVTAQDVAYTRLANAEIIQDSQIKDSKVVVRAMTNGKQGACITNDMTIDGLVKARKRAAQIANSPAGKPLESGFLTTPEALPEDLKESFDPETANISSARRHHLLAPPIQLARKKKLLLAGHCHSGLSEHAIWNTCGLARYYRTTSCAVDTIALDGLAPGDSTGYASSLSYTVKALDPRALATKAIEKALLGRNPMTLEPERYDVILEPAAVATLIEWLSFIGFSSRAVEDNTSFMANRLGETVTGKEITLIDNPLKNDCLVVPFDAEGTTKQRTVLIENGVAQNHIHDRVSAVKMNCSSTGHANSSGSGLGGGALPSHVYLKGGHETPQSLLERVDNGLLITRFHYVNGMLDPRNAVMTGLTRDGTFLIHNGRIKRGVRNLRFTDSILKAFCRLGGITRERNTVGNWWSRQGTITAPHILIRGLQFTGKTQ